MFSTAKVTNLKLTGMSKISILELTAYGIKLNRVYFRDYFRSISLKSYNIIWNGLALYHIYKSISVTCLFFFVLSATNHKQLSSHSPFLVTYMYLNEVLQ